MDVIFSKKKEEKFERPYFAPPPKFSSEVGYQPLYQ